MYYPKDKFDVVRRNPYSHFIHQFGPGWQSLTQCTSLLFGASSIVLGKRDGGVRLIAVGCTHSRLVAKCVGNSVMQAMGKLLGPTGFYGIPQGAEAVVHAIRIYLDNLPQKHLILKLDFSLTF